MRRVMSAVTLARAAVLAGVVVCLVSSTPIDVRAAEGPAPLARYFPKDDLVVYGEFDGVERHADAWKQTAAARLLNETPTGEMLESVVTQLLQRMLESDPNAKLTGKDTMTLAKHAFRYGFAFGINRKGGLEKPSCVGLVLRNGAKGDARTIVARLIDGASAPATRSESVAKPGGRKVIVVTESRPVRIPLRPGQRPAEPSGFAWWIEGDDMVLSLVTPKGADAMIAALDNEKTSAVGHPTRVALAKAEGTFQPIGFAYFDMSALPQLPPQAASLGLDRVKRFDYRWGFDGPALMTITRLVAPAPRAGVLSLLEQPTFETGKLPPLPAGLDGFTVFSFAPGTFYQKVTQLAKATDPNAAGAIAMFEEMAKDMTGKPVNEVLKRLGPLMVTYSVPSKINAPTNALQGLAQGLVHVPKSSIAIQVDDVDGFAPILNNLIERFNVSQKPVADRPGGEAPAEFQPLKGIKHGYVLSVSPSVLPLPAGMRPTVVLGKASLIIASTPAAAREALAQEGKPGGLPKGDALEEALSHVPSKVTVLSVTDTKNSMLPEVVANLPGLVQLIGSSASGSPNNGMSAVFGQVLRRGRPPVRGGRPFQLHVDADQVPAPDDLRPYLFPATFAMTVDDEGFRFISRESFPGLNPTMAAPVAVALLLPAVQASRTAARRSQSVNNLKQIGLAMHNFHSTNNRFPAPIRDKNGKPLLSWRVAILPFLEQQALFNEFHLDEPWDSPHNRELVERMPQVYAVPGAKSEVGETFYRGFSGKHTLFDPAKKQGVAIQEVTDGTSNTIGVVEAREAAPWTKPDSDIAVDTESLKPEVMGAVLPQLGGQFPNGFNALFLDGSVRFIKDTINPVTLRALLTRDAGEVVSSDSF